MVPLMRESENPRIVMVSSGLGSLAVTTNPDRLESRIESLVYPSSKAALNMVTTQYAKVLPGFRINTVDPGYTATDLNDNSGFQTVEEGATVIVEMAQVAKDGPTGALLQQGRTRPLVSASRGPSRPDVEQVAKGRTDGGRELLDPHVGSRDAARRP